MTDVVPRKRPWELHAIVILFALALGAAISTYRFDIQHQMVLGAIIISLLGLFRGHRFAWGFSAFAFFALVMFTLWQSGDAIHRYGWRIHPKLLRIHASTALALISLGLLVSCWYRGAIPAKASPLFEELPAIGRVLAIVAPIFFVIAGFASLAIVVLFDTGSYHGERMVAVSLKTICSAEADFRANDRDENRINDFWTGDVGGLWGITPPGGKEPIKLIELVVAAADGNPLTGAYPPVPAAAGPRAGGWFAALIEDRSETPPHVYGTRNTSKYGVIAYPDDYIGGLRVAIFLNENNSLFYQRLQDDIRGSDRTPPGPLKAPEYTGWPSDQDRRLRWFHWE